MLESVLKEPVEDETGLLDTYDIALEWQAGSRSSLKRALERECGLSLQKETRDTTFLSVHPK